MSEESKDLVLASIVFAIAAVAWYKQAVRAAVADVVNEAERITEDAS